MIQKLETVASQPVSQSALVLAVKGKKGWGVIVVPLRGRRISTLDNHA